MSEPELTEEEENEAIRTVRTTLEMVLDRLHPPPSVGLSALANCLVGVFIQCRLAGYENAEAEMHRLADRLTLLADVPLVDLERVANGTADVDDEPTRSH